MIARSTENDLKIMHWPIRTKSPRVGTGNIHLRQHGIRQPNEVNIHFGRRLIQILTAVERRRRIATATPLEQLQYGCFVKEDSVVRSHPAVISQDLPRSLLT